MTDIIDTLSKEPLSEKQWKKALLDEQASIAKELHANQYASALPYNPNATMLHIPKIKGKAAFTISLAPHHCKTKQLIFKVFLAAAHQYFKTDNFPETRKQGLRFCKHAWRYLDNIDLTDKNRATWLKDYEAWRVSEGRVKTQSTGLTNIKLMIEVALSLETFTKTITDHELEYLVTLTNTSTAPNDEANAINLNQWFSKHTWLRRDDIGIGSELYTRLGSPKALMNSFRITIENALLYLQACKDAVIKSFRLAGVTPKDISVLARFDLLDDKSSQHYIVSVKADIFNLLRQKLVSLFDDIPHLKSALELLVFTEVRPKFRKDILYKLLANQPIIATSRIQTAGFFTSKKNVGLFDTGFLRQLALHAVSHTDNDMVPVSLAESLLFSYMMAYQTVQSSDIPTLTLRDFKFFKRINGSITHIECDYFKGRARHKLHQVETLKTIDDIGKAVLRYIKDVTALRDYDKTLTPLIRADVCAPSNVTGLLFLACKDTALWHVINQKHQTQRFAPVFPRAMHRMLSKGQSNSSFKKTKIKCESALPESFFSFVHIKTSAVYAGADSFDPTILINLRSHKNETERSHYLVEMNQEWLDNCGRVTRAVMRDLYVNVFTASENDKQIFESEFTKAVEHLKNRSDDVLACLKVVTMQTSGHVDALGLFSKGAQIDGDLPDTIYIQDSPETVLKLMHFLAQLQEKHALLQECAPEFLFFTALPTAEWIECLLDNKRFSKASIEKGQELFDKYKSHLPPHFTAQLS